MSDAVAKRREESDLVSLLRDDDIGCSHQSLCTQAADEIERLRAALAPFVTISDQAMTEMVKIIHKPLGGLEPVTVTVTKDQFKAALAALSSTKGTDHG